MDSSTILSNLQIGAMFVAEVAYDRWSFENDLIYARFQTANDTPGPIFGELKSTLYELFWTSYVGYRVIQCDRFTMDVQAGFRMASMGLELELTRRNGSPHIRFCSSHSSPVAWSISAAKKRRACF